MFVLHTDLRVGSNVVQAVIRDCISMCEVSQKLLDSFLGLTHMLKLFGGSSSLAPISHGTKTSSISLEHRFFKHWSLR